MQKLEKYNERLLPGKPGGAEILLVALSILFTLFSVLVTLIFLPLGFIMLVSSVILNVQAFKNMSVEYEYIITEGEIDIAKINNKSRRKELKNIKPDDITIIRKANSDKAKNDISLKKDKIISYASDPESESCYAIYAKHGNGKEIIILDLDEASVEHLKAVYKRNFEE